MRVNQTTNLRIVDEQTLRDYGTNHPYRRFRCRLPHCGDLLSLDSFQKSMDKFTDKLGELIQELRRLEK